jgi:hypothetical protein
MINGAALAAVYPVFATPVPFSSLTEAKIFVAWTSQTQSTVLTAMILAPITSLVGRFASCNRLSSLKATLNFR